MPLSVIFHCVPTKNAIFGPTAGRLHTPIIAQYCISGQKLLKCILIWCSILADKLREREPITGVWGQSPWSGGQGGEATLKLKTF